MMSQSTAMFADCRSTRSLESCLLQERRSFLIPTAPRIGMIRMYPGGGMMESGYLFPNGRHHRVMIVTSGVPLWKDVSDAWTGK